MENRITHASTGIDSIPIVPTSESTQRTAPFLRHRQNRQKNHTASISHFSATIIPHIKYRASQSAYVRKTTVNPENLTYSFTNCRRREAAAAAASAEEEEEEEEVRSRFTEKDNQGNNLLHKQRRSPADDIRRNGENSRARLRAEAVNAYNDRACARAFPPMHP